MFQNRISELFAMSSPEPIRTNANAVNPGQAMAVQLLLPMITTQDIYQMAAAKAQYDYELDKLFNPEFYGDGSGI